MIDATLFLDYSFVDLLSASAQELARDDAPSRAITCPEEKGFDSYPECDELPRFDRASERISVGKSLRAKLLSGGAPDGK